MSITKTNNVWQVTQNNITLTTQNTLLDSDINVNISTLTLSQVLSYIYPIGSIYMSTVNRSPADFIGGTWKQIQDTFLISAGSNYSAGSTGGEATHTLTYNEMPKHSHEIASNWDDKAFKDANIWYDYSESDSKSGGYDEDDNWDPGSGMHTMGGGQPHNNMPPYLAVYAWKRIDPATDDGEEDVNTGTGTVTRTQITPSFTLAAVTSGVSISGKTASKYETDDSTVGYTFKVTLSQDTYGPLTFNVTGTVSRNSATWNGPNKIKIGTSSGGDNIVSLTELNGSSQTLSGGSATTKYTTLYITFGYTSGDGTMTDYCTINSIKGYNISK